MPTREDYPFVNRTGYRVSSPIGPGMRSKLQPNGSHYPPTAKPLDLDRHIRAPRARKRAGFGV